MKLFRYDNEEDIPDRYEYQYSVLASGNPFSDEKSAWMKIRQVLGQAVTRHNVVVSVRTMRRPNSPVLCSYVVQS